MTTSTINPSLSNFKKRHEVSVVFKDDTILVGQARGGSSEFESSSSDVESAVPSQEVDTVHVGELESEASEGVAGRWIEVGRMLRDEAWSYTMILAQAFIPLNLEKFHFRPIPNYRYQCILDDLSSMFALFGICISIIDTEIADTASSFVLRTIVLLSCWAIVMLLRQSYLMEYRAMKHHHKLLLPSDTLMTSGLVPWMLLEMFVAILHLPPGVYFSWETTSVRGETFYYNEDVLSLLMFLKTYLFLRSIRNHSYVFQGAGRLLCASNRVDANLKLAFRLLLTKMPIIFVLSLFISNLMICSYCYLVFERPAPDTFITDFAASIWNIIIAMTTVGFGDVYPLTYAGRTVLVIAVFIGLVATAIMISVTQNSLGLSHVEQRVIQTLDEARENQHYRTGAARCIQGVYRRWKRYRLLSVESRQKKLRISTRELIKRWRMVRLQYQDCKNAATTYDPVQNSLDKLESASAMTIESLEKIGQTVSSTFSQMEGTNRLKSDSVLSDKIDSINDAIRLLATEVVELKSGFHSFRSDSFSTSKSLAKNMRHSFTMFHRRSGGYSSS